MKIRYDLVNKVMIIILGTIFICECFDLVFKFGFNHHLFHIFCYCVAFYIGILLGRRCL